MNFVVALLTRSVIVCALSALPLSVRSQSCNNDGSPRTEVHAQPPSAEQLNTTELFSRLAARRQWRQAHIRQLSAVRNYTVKNNKGKTLASEVVLMEYAAPDRETFTTRAGEGSQYIRSHVFQRLMKFEADKVRTKTDQDSLITPENYTLEVVGRDKVGSSECLVVRAIARRQERDLFKGEIWINERNFAIVKVAGELAKSPSFWVKHVRFVRGYLQIGDFWLPSTEEAVSQIRLFGEETLTVDYRDYAINGQRSSFSGRDSPDFPTLIPKAEYAARIESRFRLPKTTRLSDCHRVVLTFPAVVVSP